jgi:succinate dehydrogenase / fumarate reductase iron-sulfur subunit
MNNWFLKKKEPVSFEHDCREGICGTCSMVINGRPHGSAPGNDHLSVAYAIFQGWGYHCDRAIQSQGFPVIKDLVVDRSAFDRIMQAGGYVSVNTGNAQDGNAIPIPKKSLLKPLMLLPVSAVVPVWQPVLMVLLCCSHRLKVSHLGLLPQGEPERDRRTMRMVAQMDKEGFGSCSNIGACEVECPKEIKLSNIARMNRYYYSASFGAE